MTDLFTALDVPDRTNVPRDEHGRPRVLIEEWLPIKELGIESVRESAPIPGQFPKIKTLHVWWARRPLAASAGTVLCSVLPIWSKEMADVFDDPRLGDEHIYRRWVLWLCGVWGDPVEAKAKLLHANANGIKLKGNGYGYRQAFKNSASPADLALLHRVLVWTWGEMPALIDPTAGGGSIPYSSARFGLPSTANDLNSVAATTLRAGVQATALHGKSLTPDLETWGRVLAERCQKRLTPFFELQNPAEEIVAYIYARTVACPRTGKETPLSPNWWLHKNKDLAKAKWTAVRPITERNGTALNQVEFEILVGQPAIDSFPDTGTQAGGAGVSLWDGLPIDKEYIKAEAQAGRMGTMLYAVANRLPVPGAKGKQRGFRTPTDVDRDAIAAATIELAERLPGWLAGRVVPEEEVPDGNDNRPKNFGMAHWRDLFSPRQLLVHGTFVEEWQRLRPEIEAALGDERGRMVSALLGLMQGKALNWNGLMSSWDSGRTKVRSVFDRHDLAFKWTYAEFEAAQLFPWCLSQLVDAIDGIAELYEPGRDHTALPGGIYIPPGFTRDLIAPVPGTVTVTRGTAASLPVETGSQTLCCIDPPYYDNVMYAELSDYFGVWEQHTIGQVWPDLMPGGLADTASEAVANVARFAHTGKRKRELATRDYEAKMQAIFAEAHRVLADEGVLTVMFTHKKAEAWDTLGMALMEAGFQIETSWPVNTESEQSMHIAKKNAAASTIMLVCRKRPSNSTGGVFFDDLVPDIRHAARTAVKEFAAAGIDGVDLLLSSYGPVLSVISEHWPVLSSEADESGNARRLRPEEALDIAREELLAAERRALVGKDIQFDPPTDFVLFAWNTFKAAEFPYDDARKLAVACAGSDIDDLVKGGVASKQTGTVTLRSPKERMKQTVEAKTLDPKAGTMIDRLWGILAIAESSGLAAAKAAMDRAGMSSDQKFTSLVQAAVNAVPRTKKKGQFTRPEAEWLDKLASTYFAGSVELPEEPDSGRLFDVD